MGQDRGGLMDKLFHQRVMRRWARAARLAWKSDLVSLRRQRAQARLLKTHLDALVHTADERLGLPVIGSNNFPKPHNADWGWRPELWRGRLPYPGISSVQTKSRLGREVTLFHDCAQSELTLRQIRNVREEDIAPYALRLDVFTFDGSFLSVVVDMPQQSTDGLKKNHVIRMDAIFEMEKPLEIFARFNVKHGPNTEQIVREVSLNTSQISVEFDLAYSDLNEKQVEKAWVDLIFEGPEMNQVVIRDLTFSRRPRAAL